MAHGRAPRPDRPAPWRAVPLVAAAIFAAAPLAWQLGLSLTPSRLLFAAGPRLWPAALTPDNYLAVLWRTSFPSRFRNSLAVSGIAALPVGLLAFTSRASADYGQLAAASVLAPVPPFALLAALAPYLRSGFDRLAGARR